MAKKIRIRHDLLSKSDYSRRYGIARPTIDAMIERGEIKVERISGIDYVSIKDKLKATVNEQ